MSAWEFIDTVNAASAFFLCCIAVFLFTHKRGRPLSNRVLGFFLLAMALSLFNFVFSRGNRLPPSLLPVFLVANGVDLALGPLLYLYVRSVVYRDFGWHKGQLLHALPIAAYFIALAVAAVGAPSSMSGLAEFRKSWFGHWGMVVLTSLTSVQLLSYVGASFLVLRSYRTRIKDAFSSLDKVSLSWLYSTIGGFGLIWLFNISNYMQAISRRSGKPTLGLGLAAMAMTFAVANIIIFRGLKQPEIFSGIETKARSEKFHLSDDEAERLLAVLKDVMAYRKPFLDSGLSIHELAKAMASPARSISQVINSRLGQNFFDFVNSYRVEEAKRLLSASGRNGRTILRIAYEAGFSSKSAFNRAFKKHAGMPPKEFRRTSDGVHS